MTERIPSPHEALASIQAARRDVVTSTKYPVSYDVAYGAVCGLLVAGQGMSQPWSVISLVVASAGLGYMIHWWRKVHGWWINGYSPRRARWVAIGTAAMLIALMGVSLYGRAYGPWWLFIVAGLAGAVIATVGGRLWMRVWRREVEEAASARS